MESKKTINTILHGEKNEIARNLLDEYCRAEDQYSFSTEVFDTLDFVPQDIALWKSFRECAIPEKDRIKASKELLSAYKSDFNIICSITVPYWKDPRDPFSRLKGENFSDEEFMSNLKIIGHPEYLKELILKGADVNQSTCKYDLLNTVCGCELSDNLLLMVIMLLKAGANPNAPDKDNNSAMMSLFANNYQDRRIEVTKALLHAGADLKWRNKYGRPVVFNLISYPATLQFFLDNDVEISTRTNEGLNIWHCLFILHSRPNITRQDS